MERGFMGASCEDRYCGVCGGEGGSCYIVRVHICPCRVIGEVPWYALNKDESLKTLGLTSVTRRVTFFNVEITL